MHRQEKGNQNRTHGTLTVRCQYPDVQVTVIVFSSTHGVPLQSVCKLPRFNTYYYMRHAICVLHMCV